MNSDVSREIEERVLLAAPTRRDAEVTCSLLNKAGLACIVCEGLGELAREAEAGAGAILLTEEAMTASGIDDLLGTLAKQPAWSDLPVVLLLRGGVLSPAATKVLSSLRNVTLLERPAPTRSVVSAVQAAIRGRARQYQIRDQIESIRRAEATSSELRRQLEIAVDASELGTFHCEMPLGRIIWNEQCKRHFWLPPEAEIDFDLFYSILHPDDRERTRQAVEACVRDGSVYDIEYRTVSPTGEIRWVHATGRTTFDEQRQPVRFDGTTSDVTAKRRAEDERQRFVTLIENSTDFIGICDLEGNPIFVNQSGLQMVGLEDIEEARRHSVWDFFFPEDQPKIQSEFFPAILESGHGEIEIRFKHFKTGEARWMLYKVLALVNAEGERTGFATVSQDISQRRQMEDDLRNSAADLSEASHRKDEFLATLAHELRNPLAPIRNSLHLMRLSGELSPSLDPVREIMERQFDQMVRLIDDLLDVSRISRGKIELQKEVIELATVVSTAVETSRPLIDAAGHQLALSLPAEPMMLDADPVRLAQIVGNLLSNAAKYTRPGGQIWLTAHQEGIEAVLSVRDSGMGIPADMLPRVFDMFAQVDRTLTRAQGGLGIGLTLAKTLVEMHGGRIEAHSEGLDQGSEFLVYLPMMRDSKRHSATTPLVRSSQKSAPSRRILIVDDTRAAGYVLGKLLETMGQQVCTVTGATEALEKARQERPDLVISDIGMPDIDGYELARRLRKESGLERLILVALTGYGQESDKQRAKEAGFDYHLIKPVSLESLHELLASLPVVSKEIVEKRRSAKFLREQ